VPSNSGRSPKRKPVQRISKARRSKDEGVQGDVRLGFGKKNAQCGGTPPVERSRKKKLWWAKKKAKTNDFTTLSKQRRGG